MDKNKMKQKVERDVPSKANEQQEKPWRGHPDDHEPTERVTPETINP
ncbi:MAG: hypothetical protein FWE07_00865 [Turicibacter sp.]|nr:hypothetical protein [Turicibacter sp.]